MIGDEVNGASIAMSDSHNAYRYYMEYLMNNNRISKSDYDEYCDYFNNYLINQG